MEMKFVPNNCIGQQMWKNVELHLTSFLFEKFEWKFCIVLLGFFCSIIFIIISKCKPWKIIEAEEKEVVVRWDLSNFLLF